MTEKVRIILDDSREYDRVCWEYAEKGQEIPRQVKAKFLTKIQREKILKSMSDEELDCLVAYSGSNQAKIYYATFKKNQTKVKSKENFNTHGKTEKQKNLVVAQIG
ncbi:MAG: hypothetical protein IJQ23_01250 [Clostridia bacterium]|nr:hypothetical protein [Clostridia bacterium]